MTHIELVAKFVSVIVDAESEHGAEAIVIAIADALYATNISHEDNGLYVHADQYAMAASVLLHEVEERKKWRDREMRRFEIERDAVDLTHLD